MRRIPLPLGIFGELPLHCFRWAIWGTEKCDFSAGPAAAAILAASVICGRRREQRRRHHRRPETANLFFSFSPFFLPFFPFWLLLGFEKEEKRFGGAGSFFFRGRTMMCVAVVHAERPQITLAARIAAAAALRKNSHFLWCLPNGQRNSVAQLAKNLQA